jgi:signal transduction histidine kinase
MVLRLTLWQASIMADQLRYRHHWIFCVAALAVWVALGWPVLQALRTGMMIRGAPVSALWLVPFTVFGAAVVGAMIPKLRTSLQWTLLCVQVAAVVAMTAIVPWAGMSFFLIITAWQVAMATAPVKALSWAVFQNLAVIGTLAQALNPDLCWILGKSFALQLLLVFTAQALRREAETARALAQTNRELRSAQAIIANTVRDAERLRISRELHDAWGHELTALGLQLEIASHVTEPGRANDHVMQAKGLARALLAKVRDVVAALREDERCDLKDALEVLAHSVPSPVIHVDISPGVRVGPDQAHALIRCAQEAVTNAVKHAEASNLWLQVTLDGEGVRLVARNDGNARPIVSAPGSGLLGMRERVESLGGRLAVQAGAGLGFVIDAWLPSGSPQAA